ncbi:MAG: dUTP diphosphatase [Desulfovibrio sp.]|nr:dUTP diphosphatase [Desulfovibrio sp.]
MQTTIPRSEDAVHTNRSRVRLAYVRAGARALYVQGQTDALSPTTPLSAGIDLRACLEAAELRVAPGKRVAVPTGISVQPVSPDMAGFVYSRSGLGARDGLTVAQGTGVIDPDYTGEIIVILLNTSGEERTITSGDRIAQLVFQPVVRPLWQEVEQLEQTERGSGGFGHTGR